MRQIVMVRSGGVDVMEVQEREDPHPGQGEVKIRVKASGVNFADIMARRGIYPDAPKKPCVVGYEVAGVVEAAGDGVDASLLGRPVIAVTRFGGYSEVVVSPISRIFEKPVSLSFEEAAAIPVTYMTAYQLLVVMGSLRKGESVLIHNAGGGVGLAAIDIARHIGAVIYGTASAGKHEFLKKRGVNFAIDYRTQNWVEEILKLTDGRGVELIIDPIGGKNIGKDYRALRRTGRIGLFGVSAATASRARVKLNLVKVALQSPRFHSIRLMNANKGVFGVHIGHLWGEEEKVHCWVVEIMKGVEEGWIRPHVDRVFSFEEAAEAHRYIEERKNIGKVILVP